MSRVRLWRWARQNPLSSVGIVLALAIVIASLLSPLLASIDPAKQDLLLGLTGPSGQHLLGTDHLGRDILSRLLWGGRTSITAAAIVLLLSLVLGTIVGVLAGYLGGIVDEILMRLVDLFLSLPTIILALALVGVLGPGFWNMILGLTLGWWPSYARLVRSQVLSTRTCEFVLAAQALGGTDLHIMRSHLLPSLAGPVLVLLSLDVGNVMLSIAGLSFLGLGIQPPSPEWGMMLVDARPFMHLAPHLILAPGLAILLAVFGFNSLGEGLEEWLNPWMGN